MGRHFKSYAEYKDGVLEIRFFECPIKVECTEDEAKDYLAKFIEEWERRLEGLKT